MAGRVFLSLAVLALGACAGYGPGYAPTENQHFLVTRFGDPVQMTVAPIYCYETLADPDCHAQPLPGREGRLIAWYGPRPPR